MNELFRLEKALANIGKIVDKTDNEFTDGLTEAVYEAKNALNTLTDKLIYNNKQTRIEAIEIAIEAVLGYIEEDCGDIVFNLTQEERDLISIYKDRLDILIKDIVINTAVIIAPYCSGAAKRVAIEQELISSNLFDDSFTETLLDTIDSFVK